MHLDFKDLLLLQTANSLNPENWNKSVNFEKVTELDKSILIYEWVNEANEE